MHGGPVEHRAYELTAKVEDVHWWWSGRRAILRDILRALYARGDMPTGPVLDLGCGVGANLEMLSEFGTAIGYDGSPQAIEHAKQLGRTGVRYADLSKGEHALDDVESGSAAVVVFADVLEHLPDERPAMALALRLLAPGGALVVTVPALPMLWGTSDVFNHHHRRYTRSMLRAAITSRFEIDRLSYFNTWLFPPISVIRVLSRLASRPGEEEIGLPPRPVNALMRAIFSSERHVLARTDLPIGVSLLCVARKPRPA